MEMTTGHHSFYGDPWKLLPDITVSTETYGNYYRTLQFLRRPMEMTTGHYNFYGCPRKINIRHYNFYRDPLETELFVGSEEGKYLETCLAPGCL
jgi:hypothetical protein